MSDNANLLSNRAPKPKSSIVFKELVEGGVVFDPEKEVYFGLNSAGSEIWKLLGQDGLSVTGLCDKLIARYTDVSAQTIRHDVTDLLRELLENGLVEPAEGASS